MIEPAARASRSHTILFSRRINTKDRNLFGTHVVGKSQRTVSRVASMESGSILAKSIAFSPLEPEDARLGRIAVTQEPSSWGTEILRHGSEVLDARLGLSHPSFSRPLVRVDCDPRVGSVQAIDRALHGNDKDIIADQVQRDAVDAGPRRYDRNLVNSSRDGGPGYGCRGPGAVGSRHPSRSQ